MEKKDKYLVITDNTIIAVEFNKILDELNISKNVFDFAHSPGNQLFDKSDMKIKSCDVKKECSNIIAKYRIVFSAHSTQVFPAELVNGITCINIHPGYNPLNRGWYPHVFAIINDQITGATIHLMDEKIDNGKIIDRIEVKKNISDTSDALYNRIIEAELKILRKNLPDILNNRFTTFCPEEKGKLFLKKDFHDLCRIDLNKKGTFREFYNLIRALTHDDYKNAYYINPETGNKIFMRLIIEP